ncbi:MAG: phasin family protein [Thermodesulfovibrionia bacterium]|nr:phasin family protein [Thermodesulfovibrionia bacterium]
MTVFDTIRRALMAGLGVPEKVKELVDELVKKGELSETQGARLVKEWSDKMSNSGDELGKSVTELIHKTLEKMNVPTKSEVDKLNRKIQTLSARLKKIEESVPGKEGKKEG